MNQRSGLVFVGIAGTCLISHNLIMIVTDWAGFALWASLMVSFVLVGLLGYWGHSRLTFRQPVSFVGLGRYGAGMATAVAIAVPVIWFWKVGLHLPMIIASPVASICTVGINFILTRWAIVRPARAVGS